MLSPAGFYVALRVGFAFPLEEVNALPREWVGHYTRNRLMMSDPMIHWAYRNSGAIRFRDLAGEDPEGVLRAAADHGLEYGVVIACSEDGSGQRTFGIFARGDRDYTAREMGILQDRLRRMHLRSAPPDNITSAEVEALRMVRDGLRLKQIAHELGVTEGAVKQRLKNAKSKLNAATSAQAASLAGTLGLF